MASSVHLGGLDRHRGDFPSQHGRFIIRIFSSFVAGPYFRPGRPNKALQARVPL